MTSDKQTLFQNVSKLSIEKHHFEIGNPVQGIRHKFAHGESSDHLLFLNLYKTWLYEYDKGKSKKFCQENNVNEHSMNTIYFVRGQIYNILESIQLIKV